LITIQLECESKYHTIPHEYKQRHTYQLKKAEGAREGEEESPACYRVGNPCLPWACLLSGFLPPLEGQLLKVAVVQTQESYSEGLIGVHGRIASKTMPDQE
jgi:hypothetical protein